jgi:acyl-CoA synthetase (AMP-forming)/AMP-acid ligase II
MQTLSRLIAERGASHGDRVAVIGEGSRYTYEGLDRGSRQVAHGLRAEGVGAGDRVAYWSKNTPEFFELLFGAARLNAPLVVLNWRLAAPEVAYILGDCQARVLVVGASFVSLLDQIRDQLRPEPVVLVLEDSYPGWRDGQSDGEIGTPSVPDPDRVSGPDDVALLLYTSGTTGRPKGVQLTHRNLAAAVRTHQGVYDLDDYSVQLMPLPLFHVGGLLLGLLAVVAGASSVVLAEAEPAAMLRRTAEHRVTHLPVVPALLAPYLALAAAEGVDLSSIRTVFYGSAPMPESLLRTALAALPGAHFMSGFGLTETSAAVTFLTFTDHELPDDPDAAAPMVRRLRSAGRSAPTARLRIVDPETLRERAVGVHGEVLVGGELVMKGYWNRPRDTARAMLADGWLRTGDGGYLDADGYLFLTDRIKDMIISGGENVYPAELENILASLSGVREVAVIGVPHERWGETPKALIVTEPGAELTERDVIGHCRARLAGYKCPTSVDWVETLPRTPSGKVMKHLLRERHTARTEAPG